MLYARKWRREHPILGFGDQSGLQNGIGAPCHDGWLAAEASTVERRPEQEGSGTDEHCRALRGPQESPARQTQAQIVPAPYWYYGIARERLMVATDNPVKNVPLQPDLRSLVVGRRNPVGNGSGLEDTP